MDYSQHRHRQHAPSYHNENKPPNSKMGKVLQENQALQNSASKPNVPSPPISSSDTSDNRPILNDYQTRLTANRLPPKLEINPNRVITQTKKVKNGRSYSETTATPNAYPRCMTSSEAGALRVGSALDYRDFEGRVTKARVVGLTLDERTKQYKYGIQYEHWSSEWNCYLIPSYQFHRCFMYKSITERTLHRQQMIHVNISPEGPFGDFIEIRPLHLYRFHAFKWEYQTEKKSHLFSPKVYNLFNEWHVARTIFSDKESAQVKVAVLRQDSSDQRWYDWVTEIVSSLQERHCDPDTGEYSYKTKERLRKKAIVYWVHLDNADECAPLGTHIESERLKSILKGKNKSVRKRTFESVEGYVPSSQKSKKQKLSF